MQGGKWKGQVLGAVRGHKFIVKEREENYPCGRKEEGAWGVFKASRESVWNTGQKEKTQYNRGEMRRRPSF